ncbi:MAG: phage major capsid protein, P2 family [Desulfovibrio sp.]
MHNELRHHFNGLCAALALGYKVDSVTVSQFNIEPSVAQQLQDKIVEQSTFLQKINVLPVRDKTGQNVLGSVSGSVSGRTDTKKPNNPRVPRNVSNLEGQEFQLYKTDSDVAMPYDTIDAWSMFPDFHQRYTRYVQEQIANDREICGWYGEAAAADTDREVNQMLQDLNKGWMQIAREKMPSHVLTEGTVTGQIRIGEGGDYPNLDAAVHDLVQGIPKHKRKNLVALIGDDLIGVEAAKLFALVGGKPSEKTLMSLAAMKYGGLDWETPSNFPGRAIVVTSYDNLSIYWQKDSWRKHVREEPENDQIADYNSRNEGYVIEDPEKFMAVEFKNVKVPEVQEDKSVLWV